MIDEKDLKFAKYEFDKNENLECVEEVANNPKLKSVFENLSTR
ncbi:MULTISPECIES: hypothetical protein [unclassified Spiroplasma]